MWSITFSISLAPRARNHLTGDEIHFFKNYILVFWHFHCGFESYNWYYLLRNQNQCSSEALADYSRRHGNKQSSRGALSQIIDLSSCPLAIWRKSYSSNFCPKYMHQKLFFFWGGWLNVQSFPCSWRPSPRSVALLPRISPRRILSETWKHKSFPEALAR